MTTDSGWHGRGSHSDQRKWAGIDVQEGGSGLITSLAEGKRESFVFDSAASAHKATHVVGVPPPTVRDAEKKARRDFYSAFTARTLANTGEQREGRACSPEMAHMREKLSAMCHISPEGDVLHPTNDKFEAAMLRRGEVPQEVCENKDLIELFTPLWYADFSAMDTYEYHTGPLLQCPIYAFGGTSSSEHSLESWAVETSSRQAVNVRYPGKCFFLLDPDNEVRVLKCIHEFFRGKRNATVTNDSTRINEVDWDPYGEPSDSSDRQQSQEELTAQRQTRAMTHSPGPNVCAESPKYAYATPMETADRPTQHIDT